MLTRRGRRIAALALLVIAAAAGGWYAVSRHVSRPRASSETAAATPDTEPSPVDRVATLENSLRALADGERDAPRDRWDPGYVVAHVGQNPDSLRKWVVV